MRITLLLALLVAACTHAAIPEPQPLEVPSGLEIEQVENAIRVAIKTARGGRGWKQGAWTIEEGARGHVVVRMAVEGRVLRVRIDYSENRVTTRIVDSRALGQDDGEIHRRAVAWQTQLETRIAEELEWSARSR